MPGWYAKLKDQIEAGEIAMIGIVQEQHPDRARLFMQWKQMDWPIWIDPLNQLEVPYVPITLAIDEAGIVRAQFSPMSDPGEALQAFLQLPPPEPKQPTQPTLADIAGSLSWDDVGPTLRRIDNLFAGAGLEPTELALTNAVWSYDRYVSKTAQFAPEDPSLGWAWFRLGVAYRMRYDSPFRQPNDFQAAVDAWTAALEIDPNNYIWRRRIQQYGPRLDKPYPFYDWVVTAREEISARGETPVPLRVEPRGSEFAMRQDTFEPAASDAIDPDPHGKITRDDGELITAEVVAVPARVASGKTVRVHVELKPTDSAHWNNEVDDLLLWIEAPEGWSLDAQAIRVPVPKTTLSHEPRQVEFELLCPAGAAEGTATVRAHALYYVCEDVNGVCLYRRQDLDLELAVVSAVP